MLASSYVKLELISLRLHLFIYQLLFIHTMLLNFEFMWVGIYLFISSTLEPSSAQNMCFKNFKFNFFPAFLPLSSINIGF